MTPPPRTPPAADPGGEAGLGEFELIDRYFAPLAKAPGALGLQDDAAILQAPPGEDLIVTCDALVEGVHFLPDDPPESIGHKALAVNFSDLAAKGAAPLGYLLALSLPDPPSKDWLAGFARGLHALQQEIGTSLLGGDTTATPGPLTIAVTALGAVPAAGAVLRRGAVPGDRIFVSGTIGDAGLGLRLLREPGLAERWKMAEGQRSFLIDRYRRPQARTDLIKTLRAHAHAAIDLSDGLAGDLEKLGCRSGMDIQVDTARIPFSPAARKALTAEPGLLPELLAAGDDYEIAAAIPPNRASAFEKGAGPIAVTEIGTVDKGAGGVTFRDAEGREIRLSVKGFAHF